MTINDLIAVTAEHPLVVLAMEQTMGAPEQLTGFMREGLIKASIFSFCMPKHWIPNSLDRDAYKKAVTREVEAVEATWKEQKSRKSLPPRDTAIFLLKEKWAPMIVHCSNLGDMQDLVARMEALARESASQFQR